MNIDKKQLTACFNLHSLQPGFLNSELYYIIAQNSHSFRFANWYDEPQQGEQRFYCFLSEDELFVEAGNVNLSQSYVLMEEPIYPVMVNADDFIDSIRKLPKEHGVAKGIRQFSYEKIDGIKDNLCEVFGECEKHIIASNEAKHELFVVNNVEISIAAAMVYFRYRSPLSDLHYDNIIQEQHPSSLK